MPRCSHLPPCQKSHPTHQADPIKDGIFPTSTPQHSGFGITLKVLAHVTPKGDLGGQFLTQDLEADGAAGGGMRQQLHPVVPAVVAVAQERDGGSGTRGQQQQQQEEGAAPSHGGDSDAGARLWLGAGDGDL